MFKLSDLPFEKAALEPAMSALTLETHHGKHHAGYIKKTNAALEERGETPTALEEVVRLAAREKDKRLFNNAAQAWNHGFFWQCLSPQRRPRPEGDLMRAIERKFSAFDKFVEEARTRGENHFASGWLWIVADADGEVALEDLHDAQTPIVDPKVTPLLVCDVWEHAYYLDYKNDRAAFLSSFFDRLANWRFAESQYDAAHGGGASWRYPA